MKYHRSRLSVNIVFLTVFISSFIMRYDEINHLSAFILGAATILVVNDIIEDLKHRDIA